MCDITGGSALHECAVSGGTTVARILLGKGADVRRGNLRGNTPLFIAAQEGNAAVARLLLDNGADVNQINRMNESALSYAVRGGGGLTEGVLPARCARGKLTRQFNLTDAD